MEPSLLVRFKPTGPWRIGPASGFREHVDSCYHSDAAYSAVTSAMGRLGLLESWLQSTAENAGGSAVRLSSFYPSLGGTLFVVPPRIVWPPIASSSKVRWKGAQFIPVSLVRSLLNGEPLDEDRWTVDGPSECLVPRDVGFHALGPFRSAVRHHLALDRGTGVGLPHSTACLEFAPEGGLWCAVVFSGEEERDRWQGPVQAALRLLADSGFGGERSQGWGRSEMPEFTEGILAELLLGSAPAREEGETAETPGEPQKEAGYWLLSLYSPAGQDPVDWERGSYAFTDRRGRVESPVRWGEMKQALRMVSEGSVLFAAGSPKGMARNVAPEGFPHPVYRAGFAVTVPIMFRVAA